MNSETLSEFDEYRIHEAEELKKLTWKQLLHQVFTKEVKAEISRREQIKFKNKQHDKIYYGK